jgi:hypothetical protein
MSYISFLMVGQFLTLLPSAFHWVKASVGFQWRGTWIAAVFLRTEPSLVNPRRFALVNPLPFMEKPRVSCWEVYYKHFWNPRPVLPVFVERRSQSGQECRKGRRCIELIRLVRVNALLRLQLITCLVLTERKWIEIKQGTNLVICMLYIDISKK